MADAVGVVAKGYQYMSTQNVWFETCRYLVYRLFQQSGPGDYSVRVVVRYEKMFRG